MADSTPQGITPGTDTTNGKWRLDVRPGDNTAGTFLQVKGMSDFTPSVDTTTQDSTNYDSQGWGSKAVTMRSWSCDVTVQRKRYTKAYDPGQEVLRAAADAGDALVEARWYERIDDGGTDAEAYTGFAMVTWAPDGGGVEGLSTVKVSLVGQGARLPITVPTT